MGDIYYEWITGKKEERMTRIVCDFCGKDAGNKSALLDAIREFSFCISRNGNRLDMCEDCRKSFDEWWKQRKAIEESEVEE